MDFTKLLFHPESQPRYYTVNIARARPYGGSPRFFLKPNAERLVVFRAKMWANWLKVPFHRKRAHTFKFFGTVFNETQQTKVAVFTFYFVVKSWNIVVYSFKEFLQKINRAYFVFLRQSQNRPLPPKPLLTLKLSSIFW